MFMFANAVHRRRVQTSAAVAAGELEWTILPRSQHAPRVLLAMACGGVAMPNLFLLGLDSTHSPVLASICDGPLLPVSTTILALLLRYEQFPADGTVRTKQLCGLAACVAGAIVVIVSAAPAADGAASGDATSFSLGVVALVAESFAFGASLVVQKPLLQSYPSNLLPAWQFGIGAVGTSMLIAAGQGSSSVLDGLFSLWCSMFGSARFLVGLLYCVLAQTVTIYVLLTYANGKLASSTVALYACTQPVMTVTMEFAFLGKPVVYSQLLGIAILVVGLWSKLSTDQSALKLHIEPMQAI